MISSRLDRIEALFGKPVVFLPVLLACMVVGFFNALPHMHESLWQDESATISFHVSRGIVDPFLHYISPNSHVLFTSLLAAWIKAFPGGLDLVSLRSLPLLLFMAAIPATFAAALRLGGAVCACLAALVFSTSVVAENFATQLRGYGPSWLFIALALLCALSFRTPVRRLRSWQTGYFLASTAAIAILPTNFYFVMIISIAMCCTLEVSDTAKAGQKREAALVLLAAPILGLLLAYSAIWRELMYFAGVNFSQWTRQDLVIEWLRGSLASIRWVAPLAGAGALAGLVQILRQRRASDAPYVVASLLIAGFLASLVLMPNPPFPRTLTPYLPVWVSAIALLMWRGVRALATLGERASAGLGAALVAGLIFATPVGAQCKGSAGSGDRFDYGLCHQYFRDEYHPEQVLDAWASQPRPLPIVSDFEGFHALRILGSSAQVFEYREYSIQGWPQPLIVAHTQGDMRNMASSLGLDPRSYSLTADTGYFKVFRYQGLP